MNTKQNVGQPNWFVQWFVHLFVIICCIGFVVPGVNESHYLPKAKHAWDSSFAQDDLFLASHDSHLLASKLAGFISSFAEFEQTAWIGRLLSWSLFAGAWTALSRTLAMPLLLSPFALAAWFFAMHFGHWAGEWAMGGFEAKTLSYPFVIFALASAISGKWNRSWILLAIAVAWHPLAGGWAGLTFGCVWLLQVSRGKSTIRSQLPWLGLGVLIGLIGVVPAFAGIGGEDRIGKVVASQVHVYFRLAHHMSPRTFASERHIAAVATLSLLVICTLVHRYVPSFSKERTKEHISLLLQIAWFSVAIAIIGLMIDVTISVARPSIASKLLRFYWFRWADVMVPLAWTLCVWLWLIDRRQLDVRQTQSIGMSRGTMFLKFAFCVVLLALLARHAISHWSATPEADRLLVEAVGRHARDSDRLVDWQAACSWAKQNTPSDSLWLTPKHQQTFKWYAGRAEVVCWKDVPQDNPSVFEWFARIQDCEPPHYRSGGIAPWEGWQISLLRKKYGFGWVMVDRSVQNTALPWEQVYPVGKEENPSFAIYKLE